MSNYRGFEYEENSDRFPEDFLEIMFDKQIRLQKRLGNNMKTQEFRTTMTLACIDELMEAIRETPWKPWKKQQKYNRDKFKKELIDVWHFVINLTISSGMSPEELFRKFIQKNKVNHKRQDGGY